MWICEGKVALKLTVAELFLNFVFQSWTSINWKWNALRYGKKCFVSSRFPCSAVWKLIFDNWNMISSEKRVFCTTLSILGFCKPFFNKCQICLYLSYLSCFVTPNKWPSIYLPFQKTTHKFSHNSCAVHCIKKPFFQSGHIFLRPTTILDHSDNGESPFGDQSIL